ncbi:MAG: hypothetical protein GF331_20755 [Chitinivibrionales bacterium]|nr:hypothetical protein [Chitinivibrionales bacterium]
MRIPLLSESECRLQPSCPVDWTDGQFTFRWCISALTILLRGWMISLSFPVSRGDSVPVDRWLVFIDIPLVTSSARAAGNPRTKGGDMKCVVTVALAVVLLFGASGDLHADTYRVGPGRTYTELGDVTGLLGPGDTALVDGNQTYSAGTRFSRSGTADAPIVIAGLQPQGGSRPAVTGTANYGIEITGDHVVLHGFEIDGMPKGVGVFGDNITVRACIIHGCNHGLIGYGTGTGNVTVEYCEFYGNGVPTGGATQHQIYMATDEENHPGSVFRLQYCYLHDAVEGDNVKSRAERNEIYYNWVENAGTSGHGLGLFAPDPEDNANVSIGTAREDADVVGNVIIQGRNSCARIGGDIPGQPTNGRYRFVNNTFILTGSRGDVIRTFNVVETLEMYNNVVYNTASGADIRVLNDADGAWVHSPRSVTGSHNWIVDGATRVPTSDEWSSTFRGAGSPFADVDVQDYSPGQDGALVDAGTASTPTITEYTFPDPLFPPAFHPPLGLLIDTGAAEARPTVGTIDIGAFEASSQAVAMDGFRGPCRPLSGGWDVGAATRGELGIDGRLTGGGVRAAAGMRLRRSEGFGGTGGGRIIVLE